jgi:CBS domain-containing protein
MIFTHGDFVRHFQSDSKIGERLVADLMTSNPVTVHKEKLVAEVLNLLERHRIDDLVAIDESNVAAPAHEKDRCGKTLPLRLRSGQALPASNGAWKLDCLKQSSSEAVQLLHDSASRRRPHPPRDGFVRKSNSSDVTPVRLSLPTLLCFGAAGQCATRYSCVSPIRV